MECHISRSAYQFSSSSVVKSPDYFFNNNFEVVENFLRSFPDWRIFVDKGYDLHDLLSGFLMGQKKLIRFAELKSLPNVLEFPWDMAGNWNKHFKNDHPIILELACGKGEYTTGLAALYPEKNFIGIDVKGNRIWVGAKKAIAQGLPNVAFLRIQIDMINHYFSAGEVEQIWITFPDPQLRVSKSTKRLTHPKFLRLYKEILHDGGLIHLKTDSPDLYAFTKLVIARYGCKLQVDMDDIYMQDLIPKELTIKTHYESLDIAGSNKVHYLSFSLPSKLPPKEVDHELKEYLKKI